MRNFELNEVQENVQDGFAHIRLVRAMGNKILKKNGF